jgi:hypothetical protein
LKYYVIFHKEKPTVDCGRPVYLTRTLDRVYVRASILYSVLPHQYLDFLEEDEVDTGLLGLVTCLEVRIREWHRGIKGGLALEQDKRYHT